MLNTIKQLLKIPTIIILDGLDEFRGKKELVFALLDKLVAQKHQIITTGRVHEFENFSQSENHFYNKSKSLSLSNVLERKRSVDPWAKPLSGIKIPV